LENIRIFGEFMNIGVGMDIRSEDGYWRKNRYGRIDKYWKKYGYQRIDGYLKKRWIAGLRIWIFGEKMDILEMMDIEPKDRYFQGYNARKFISELYASFVLQCTVSGRYCKHKSDVTV